MGLAKIGLLNVSQVFRIGHSKVASCTNLMPAAVIGHLTSPSWEVHSYFSFPDFPLRLFFLMASLQVFSVPRAITRW